MVVALSAADGEAHKRLHRRTHHVIAIEVAGDFAINLVFAHFSVAHEVPWSCRNEAERLDAIARIRIEHVPRNLFLHKARPGFVFIQ